MCLLSFSFLSIIARAQSLGVSTLCSLSTVLFLISPHPCPHTCASPSPAYLLGWAALPGDPSLRRCPCFRSAARDPLLGGPARDSLHFWPMLVALLSPTPHTPGPAPQLKRCHQLHLLHYSQGLFSWSSLASGLAPSCLPCPWNPALLSVFSPHLVPVILPAPKLYSTMSAMPPNQRWGRSSSVLPCLSYRLSQPRALKLCTAPR